MRRFKPTCKAKTRRGTACQCKPLPGKKRCKFHGGASTGPRTPEGRAQSAVNLLKARAFLLSDDPRAIEARRRGAAKASATRALRRRRAEADARWRNWCGRHGLDPVTGRHIPRVTP